jgi:hypothetical protein
VEKTHGLPVAEVMAASGGTPQKQRCLIEAVPVAGIGGVLPLLEEHLAFQVARDGILFAASPIWSDGETDWDGGQARGAGIRAPRPSPSAGATRCMRRAGAGSACVPGRSTKARSARD